VRARQRARRLRSGGVQSRERTACHLAGGRGGHNRALRVAQAVVPGGEALWTKMGDAHAEHAPEGQ
jgi:hypothetical protein